MSVQQLTEEERTESMKPVISRSLEKDEREEKRNEVFNVLTTIANSLDCGPAVQGSTPYINGMTIKEAVVNALRLLGDL